ncbi:MAG: CRTAC1 family protein, partial [Myxococcales bacterium]|nr:CRTAC1 family protein [Myxococcales bacterium]
LDARALELVERAGPDAFAPALELDPEPQIHVAARHVQPVLVHDLDGDGRAEVLLVGANRLYRNRSAKGAIKLVEEELLPKDVYYSMPGAPFAAVLADVDGDGVVDLVTAHVAGDINLFSGTSKGGFSTEPRVAARMPVPLDTPVALTAGDIDSDGDLDLFVGQYKRPYVHGQMPTPYYDANDGDPAYLLRNDGRGAFTDITDEAGLAAKRRRRTWSASLLDLDDDRKLDLIVVSDFSGLDLYKGDGAGHFTDVTAELVDERASFGMSHTIGDYNLDGFLDLYVVGMSSTTARRLEQLGLGREGHEDIQEMRMKMAYGNRLYDGDARHRLRAGAFAQDVARTGWSWGSTSFDFDRDGDLDIYVVNGHISRETAKDYCTTYWRHDVYTGTSERDAELERFFLDEFQTAISEGVSWNGFEHNKLFVTDPARGFVEAGFPLDVALEDDARATVSEDLDLDGRPDLLVVLAKARAGKVRGESTDERLAVLQNQWSSPNKWVGVRLGGARSPIGARVTVEVEGAPTQQHRVVTGDSLQSQHAPHKLFGLGPEARVNAIAVEWADGTTTRLERPALDRYHVMR